MKSISSRWPKFLLVLSLASLFLGMSWAADDDKDQSDIGKRIDNAAKVLDEIMATPDKAIPDKIMHGAKCVAVIPSMVKIAVGFGGNHGKGVATCRTGAGWSAPAAMRSEGGSFGFQIGASDTDVVLLVMNDGGMKHLLSDKFTLGGDATVAAGPIGRAATAQTEVELQAEILSYSRSHGLFAGISLTGATLRPDNDTNRDLYQHHTTNREILTGDFKTPVVAAKFEGALNRDSTVRN